MVYKRVVQLAFLATLGLSVGACEQSDVRPAPNAVATSAAEVELTPTTDRNQLAQLLAVELGANGELREFLQKQAMAQFDGDYDVLYQHVAKETIGGETLEDIFTRQYVNQAEKQGRDVSSEEARSWVQRTIAGIPLCQISVPLHCEEWEASAYSPAVLALPTDFDDMKVESFVTYNQDGKEEIIPGREEPSKPVVVIGTSERVNEKGELEVAPDAGTSARVSGAGERLERYQIRDIGAIENWVLGGPELRMQYWVSPMPNYNTYPYQPVGPPTQMGSWDRNPSRNSVKNHQWIQEGSLLFYWYTAQYGQTFRDIWVERDPGPNIRLNLVVELPKGVKLTFNPQISANDERMGEQFVNFADPHWPQNQQTAYSPGEINYFHGSY